MSKVWDLSCRCSEAYAPCAYCMRLAREEMESAPFWAKVAELRAIKKDKKEPRMSADWLHDDDTKPQGYHTTPITRGVYGESSKILEEVHELIDSERQGARIMALHELSDIIGAVTGYMEKHYPHMKLEDLITMAALTRRAFESGDRK